MGLQIRSQLLQKNGTDEEGRQSNEADDQERGREDVGGAASVEAEGLRRCSCILRRDCVRRGQKERHLFYPRTLQDQDSHKTSDEGWNQEHLRQGGESCSETCKKGGQGLP